MIDLSSLESYPWFSSLQIGPGGIWTVADHRCAIGVVLLARRNEEILLVRKAAVKGYEFSSNMTLPGGLVRAKGGSDFGDDLKASLFERVSKESGLHLSEDTLPRLIVFGHPPVTSYTVKEQVRYTLVLAAEIALSSDFEPRHGDHSVDQALLAKPPFMWSNFAPANRIILARHLRDSLSASEKSNAHLEIGEAVTFCNSAAKSVKLPELVHPWS